ncbi:26S proteasome non-ATPase regulatory subunit 5 [Achroia grisella]|uniref:26S proteasome non-ATPase regulatory subunit 5 n=1 Tax=Achroia grisella TaxID=688607 RepID=UPI0027D2D66F|nr:26S proteasome non-ATPase regulatory subunit 5 [Achroia grisella]
MSNQDSEQYRGFIEKLSQEEHRSKALNDIKNLFQLKPAAEAASTIRDVGIARIVHCLNVTDKSQVDLTCEVLKICFGKFQVGDVVKKYTGHIMYLLRHEKECVRRLAIDEISKCAILNPGLLPVPEYINVFIAVAQLVSDKDITVANKAVLISSSLPFEAYPKVLEEMKIALEYTVSSKCNAFEVVVNISCKSFELFKLCADLGYIEYMVSQLQSNDLLYQVNILELLSCLAVKPQGINYLVKNGALEQMAQLIGELQNSPLGNLVIPGYMKLFGCIVHHYPKEILNKYPALLDLLFDSFDSSDQTLLLVALDTLGFIGATIEGKLSLVSLGSKYTQAVEKVAQLIRNSATEIKIRALHCFASLIAVDKDTNVPKSGPIDHRVTLMTREWFRCLSENPMKFLCDICKNPFSDIRLAAFNLLNAACQHQWGEELVARVGGFIEYLLDRSVDYTKAAKEAKYEVIKKLAHSMAFDEDTLGRIQTYIQEGPFFSESTMDVAMEEGD